MFSILNMPNDVYSSKLAALLSQTHSNTRTHTLDMMLTGCLLEAHVHLCACKPRGWHCIGDCTPTHNRGQSEVKWSRRNFEAGQGVKQTAQASFKASPGTQWAWLTLNSQGSRPNFWCRQGVKHENLMGQDLDPSRGWEYRSLCSVTPL